MSYRDQNNELDRLHRMIKRKATWSPTALSSKFGVSVRTIYNYYIEQHKAMGAPVYYCKTRKSYCYEYPVKFFVGYVIDKEDEIFGGKSNYFDIFYQAANILQREDLDLES